MAKEKNLDKNIKDYVEFTNLSFKFKKNFTEVLGEVKNLSDKKIHFNFKVIFYGEDEKIMGYTTGSVYNLNPNETKIFSAMDGENYSNYSKYEIELGTIVIK